MHAGYYRRAWGFGDFFKEKVARDLAEFREASPHCDCGLWFARRADGAIAGSIAIDGRRAADCGAHLRWFIVDDLSRGTGAGARLIDAALAFCRARGFASVYLWTFAGLDSARRLYESRGFRLAGEAEAETWGTRVREQKFVLTLRA
ncbi:MAG: GNAT family N-acetyltransferase [Hyphomicrobiales bacterium]|nr:GNAT family N-acetyltransferase [Hyphomicrobiales bacterium]